MFVVLCWSVSAIAQKNDQFTRVERQSFAAPAGTTLSVKSSFGKLTFVRTSTATIDVKATAIANVGSKELADKILDAISISMKQKGDRVSIETQIGKMPNKKGESSFEVNFEIALPASVNLEIDHEFGDIALDELTGNADIDLDYGAMYAKKLSGKEIALKLDFSKATVETLSSAKVDVSYGSFELGSGSGLLLLHSEFSQSDIETAENLEISSSYDEVDIENLQKMNYKGSFSTLKIGSVALELIAEASYGSVTIDLLGKQFQLLDASVSFGGLKVRDSNDLSFRQIDVSTEMGGFSYPKRFTINQKEVEITSARYRGGNSNGSAQLLKAKVQQGEIEIN